MKALLVAVAFLTRVPMPVTVDSEAELGRSVPWFPLVGAMVGAVVGGVVWLSAGYLNSVMAAAIGVVVGLGLTGAFHEDGLADAFDGLGSGRRGADAIAIMRDSRLGTFGTAALVMALLIHVFAIAGMARPDVIVVLVAAHAASRALAVVAMVLAPVASSDGLGVGYMASISRPAAWVGVAAGLIASGLLLGAAAWGIAVGALLGALVVAWSIGRIGGVTGDVLGAVQQVGLLAVLVVATI